MIRWILVVFLALVLISWFSPALQKLGFGKLPGDLRFKVFGRELFKVIALHKGVFWDAQGFSQGDRTDRL